ncbi:MAG: DNA modification methylase [Candidatus Eisenbacteria bacterium]|nr:DNA modification methylase [Candidatus Eisenbacteria bacterium]
MHTQETLQVEWVPIDRLFCSPSNPRLNADAVPHVAASIKRFGWRQPIVAKPSGEVIAGNTRLKAATTLGLEKAPVVWFEGSDLEATAYAIADNRTHEFAEWDDPALGKLLQTLRAEDALDGVGFNDEEIDALLAEMDAVGISPNEIDDPGPEPPPVNPVSNPGDLWILSNHRLLCGDSTHQEDIARLMRDEKASLLSTDPPYCVNYTGNDRPIHDGKPSGKDWSHVYREVDIADLGTFLDGFFSACLPFCERSSAVYVWHAHVQQPVIAAAFERHGLLLHQVIVWVKPVATFGHSYYRWRHEPCAFGWRKGHKPAHGFGKMDTVWEIDWEGKSRVVGNEHPTQKALRLFEIPMEQHTKPGAIVLEPFSGSGSQLLAAERLGRRCRALELQPAFVDVAVKRWEKATGKEAVLDETGKTFNQLAEERG